MKKIITMMLTLSMVASLFVGCGKAAEEPTKEVETTKAVETTTAVETTKSTEKVTIKLWQYRQEIVETLQEVLNEYTKANPNVTIEAERPGGDQYHTTIKVMLASGDTPDIFAIQPWGMVKDYAKGGNLLELTNEPLLDNVSPVALKPVTVDGKIYALPMQIDGIGIVYNRKLFKDAGITAVPQTITELKAACDLLKAKKIIPFAVAFKDAWTLRQLFSSVHTPTVDISQFVESMNVGTGSFKSDKMDKAFETLDLIAANANEKPFDSDYNNLSTLMGQGKAAMAVQGLWVLPNIKKIDASFDSGFFALPISDNAEETKLAADVGIVYGIYPQSKNIAEAKKLMAWLTTKETGEMLAAKCGFLTPFKTATPPQGGGTCWTDLSTYVSTGKIAPWGFSIWPSGYDMNLAQLFQGYYLKSYTKDQFYSEIDKTWQKFVKK